MARSQSMISFELKLKLRFEDEFTCRAGSGARTNGHIASVRLSAMAAKKDVSGLVDASREIRRSPSVGMQFLHEGPVGGFNIMDTGPRIKPKDLIGLLLHYWPGPRRAAPARCRIGLRVLTPAGIPAVKIRCK